jgi:tetratricopeptide (TPR) repeat protein
MCQIYLAIEEYDKAIETATTAKLKDNFQLGYNHAILTSLIKQGKNEEAEKHINNITYMSLTQLYTNLTNYMLIEKNEEKLKKINTVIINLFEIFSDDSPGPFDFYLFGNYQVLAIIHMALKEYDEGMRCFNEAYNHAEKFKIFSETKEINSDFIKHADKNRFLYNMPYDYKKHLLAVFDALETQNSNEYFELKSRDDFQRFVEKLKG